jgi:hypothetical protein
VQGPELFLDVPDDLEGASWIIQGNTSWSWRAARQLRVLPLRSRSMRCVQALSTARLSGLDLTGEVLPRLGHDLISQRDRMEMIHRDRSPGSHIRSAFRNTTEGSVPTTCTARRHSSSRANSQSPTPCGPGRRPHPGRPVSRSANGAHPRLEPRARFC